MAASTEAGKVQALFARDAQLVRQWDEDLAGGKWRAMMSQTHIGYTYWQQPPTNVIPATGREAGRQLGQRSRTRASGGRRR